MVELQEALLGLAETDKLVVMKYVKSALPCFILVIYAPAWNQIRRREGCGVNDWQLSPNRFL